MRKLMLLALLIILTLTACEQFYDCASPEARSSCSRHLAGAVTATEFDALYERCTVRGRYIPVAQSDLFTINCLTLELGVEQEVFIDCFSDGADKNYHAGRGFMQNRMIGIILCANGLDYTNTRSNQYPNQ